MKNIEQIRQENLMALIERYGVATGRSKNAGLHQHFALKCDLNPSHLSHLITGHRNMGPKIARKIEQQMELPAGWMDRDQTDWKPQVRELAALLNQMDESQLQAAINAFKDQLLVHLGKPKP